MAANGTLITNPVQVIEQLRAQVAALQQENAALIEAAGGTNLTTTLPPPVVVVKGLGVQMKESDFELSTLLIVIGSMLFLWALPFMKPFKRICETKRHRVIPVVTIINFIAFGITLHEFQVIHFNQLFEKMVQVFGLIIDQTETVLIAVAAAFLLWVFWNFKDRIMEAIGVDNPAMVVGDCRDWMTCWSMQRFKPLELHIWKVEDLPSTKLYSNNDLFIQVTFGYNVNMRTRVHPRAGQTCLIKESLQFNFDPFDREQRLHLNVKNQDMLANSDIAAKDLGASQIERLSKQLPDALNLGKRTLGWGGTASQTSAATSATVWQGGEFERIELVPKGAIYLRFTEVRDEELSSVNCCPCSLL